VDWLSFIAAIVQAGAWPLAVVVIILILRKPLAGLIPLLQRLKYKDLELEFGERVEEVKAEADAVLPPTAPLEGLAEGDRDRLRQLSILSPRSAVLESWRRVEHAALAAAERNHVALPFRKEGISPVQVIRELERAELIDREQSGLLADLRILRNRAAHAPDFALSGESALDYASTADRLVRYLNQIEGSA
jgi:hypothetical protein